MVSCVDGSLHECDTFVVSCVDEACVNVTHLWCLSVILKLYGKIQSLLETV